MVLALSFSKPLPLGSFLSRLGSGTTADRFAVPIPNFVLRKAWPNTAGSETASIRLLSLGFAVNAYGTRQLQTALASTTLAQVVCSLPWGVRI